MRYKQDFSKELRDLDSKPVRLGLDGGLNEVLTDIGQLLSEDQRKVLGDRLDGIFGKNLTLGAVCVRALLAAHQDEKTLGDQERIRRYELARRINKGGSQDFNTEERDLMKKLVGKAYDGSLVAPMVWELLEEAERVVEVEPARAA